MLTILVIVVSHLIPLDTFFAEYRVHQAYVYAGGDIMLSRGIGARNHANEFRAYYQEGDYHPILEEKPCAGGQCVLFFNLESPFHDKHNDYDIPTYVFRADPRNVATLLDLRGDNQMVLSLANNHSNNAGEVGIETTHETLRTNRIISVGSGMSHDERSPVAVLHDTIQLCFTAYSYDAYIGHNVLSPSPTDEQIAQLTDDLLWMDEHDCDVKILSYHHAGEYRMHPTLATQQRFHTYIDMGFDLILGHHAHVPMTIEIYGGKYIFYGFGNMLFDQDWGARICNPELYDTVVDSADPLQPRCTTPTYLGLNALIYIRKFMGVTTISLANSKILRTVAGQQTRADELTETELLKKIFQTPDSSETNDKTEL